MIQSIGLFWRHDQVFWGKGNQAGRLLGVPAKALTTSPIDFREQIGIYVLYSDYHPIYVGQAGSGNAKIFNRLKKHLSDDLAERWDRFSWYGLRKALSSGGLSNENKAAKAPTAAVLNQMEAILIHSIEPASNRQGGRFGDSVTRFLQKRDSRLGPTTDEIMKRLVKTKTLSPK